MDWDKNALENIFVLKTTILKPLLLRGFYFQIDKLGFLSVRIYGKNAYAVCNY